MSSPHSCIASHSPLARSKLLLYDCSCNQSHVCVFTIPALAHKKERQEFRKNSVAVSEPVLVFFSQNFSLCLSTFASLFYM